MPRLFIILIGLSFFLPNLHAQEGTMSETERIELLAKSDSLFAAGVDLYNNGKFEEAIPIFAESDQIDKAVLDPANNRRDYSAMWLASCYYLNGDTTTAQDISPYYNIAPVDRRLTVQSDSLCTLAWAAYNAGNLKSAVLYAIQCVEIEKNIVGEEHVFYGNSAAVVALFYCSMGEYSSAAEYERIAQNIKGPEYLGEMASFANTLHKKAINSKDDYTVALRLGEQALAIREHVLGKKHPYCAMSLSALSNIYYDLGIYAEAIRLCAEAMNIYEKANSNYYFAYVLALNRLAVYYSEVGNFKEALRLGNKIEDIYKEMYGYGHYKYAEALSNLAVYNFGLGDLKEAIRLCTDALNIRKIRLGKEHPSYAHSLGDLAVYISKYHGNYPEAIRLGTEALNIYEEVYGKEDPNCAQLLISLANYNYALGKYEEAIALATRAKDIYKTYGRQIPFYATMLSELSLYGFVSGNSQLCNCYTTQFSELTPNLIKQNFTSLSSTQRAIFWGKYSDWYEKFIHSFAYGMPTDTLVLNGYNAVLLSKGLLLNSDIEFSKLIRESDDSVAIEMYGTLCTLRQQINKLREKPKAERYADVDSLERIAQEKEDVLIKQSKVYGNYTKNLVITWDQVQEKLTDKDIAIEFVSFSLNADSTMYIAYTLKKGWKCPKMVSLFEEKELKAVDDDKYYTSDKIANLVWKPLTEVLDGVETVYFSPGGELYNIAIESVPSWEDGGKSLVSDKRDFYRLSSTRELSLIKDESHWDAAAVYGGLQYDMSVRSMMNDDKQYPKQRGCVDLCFYVTSDDDTSRDDRDVHQGLPYLKGTKVEAMAVKKCMDADRVPAQLFTDSIGTEASFKALSGKKTSIIHIGTHGFFNKIKKEYNEAELQSSSIGTLKKMIEDAALTNSGLYFAGADNAINDKSVIPNGIDDGKLTALEIAQLDLRGLDLVVLSACQTGLGEITGDGVFGLQRGFKKAGAQTIVMSLWKVDDDATTEFMTRFFQNIKIDNEGHPTNKQQAFREAQNHIRTVDNGKYKDPKYWAAFVMLDGIDM